MDGEKNLFRPILLYDIFMMEGRKKKTRKVSVLNGMELFILFKIIQNIIKNWETVLKMRFHKSLWTL